MISRIIQHFVQQELARENCVDILATLSECH